MKTALKKAWAADLRSKQFVQATEKLHKTDGHGRDRNTRNGYCCLGVLSCRIAKLKPVRETGWSWDGTQWMNDAELAEGGFSSHPDGYWGVLPPAVRDAIGLSTGAQDELTSLNDSGGKTFTQIAKWIESQGDAL